MSKKDICIAAIVKVAKQSWEAEFKLECRARANRYFSCHDPSFTMHRFVGYLLDGRNPAKQEPPPDLSPIGTQQIDAFGDPAPKSEPPKCSEPDPPSCEQAEPQRDITKADLLEWNRINPISAVEVIRRMRMCSWLFLVNNTNATAADLDKYLFP